MFCWEFNVPKPKLQVENEEYRPKNGCKNIRQTMKPSPVSWLSIFKPSDAIRLYWCNAFLERNKWIRHRPSHFPLSLTLKVGACRSASVRVTAHQSQLVSKETLFLCLHLFLHSSAAPVCFSWVEESLASPIPPPPASACWLIWKTASTGT